MLDEDAAREIMAELDKQDEERKAEEAKKEENSLKAPGQVVDLPTPREEKRPDDAKFVSEHDSSVERETKKYGRFEDNARRAIRTGRVGPAAGDAGGRRPAGDANARSRKIPARPGQPGAAARAGRPGSALRRARPRAAPSRTARFPSWARRRGLRPGGGGARGGTGPSLMPSEEQLARAIGGGTQDALRDIDDGDETALNSKRWRFASFFNRVKRQVAEHWHPDEVTASATRRAPCTAAATATPSCASS